MRVWASVVGPVVICLGAPFTSSVRGQRSDSSVACSVHVLFAKRKEWRGEGLGLLLDASVMRHGAEGRGWNQHSAAAAVGSNGGVLFTPSAPASPCATSCASSLFFPAATVTIGTRRADKIGLREEAARVNQSRPSNQGSNGAALLTLCQEFVKFFHFSGGQNDAFLDFLLEVPQRVCS